MLLLCGQGQAHQAAPLSGVTQGWPLGRGDSPGVPGSSHSFQMVLGCPSTQERQHGGARVPQLLSWERPGMGQKGEVMAFKGPMVLHLEPMGISAWPHPFHPLPRGLGEGLK